MPGLVLNAIQRILEPLPIRGKVHVADALLKNAEKEVACHPFPGITIALRPQQRIERWMWAGGYERDLVSLMKRTLKPGMIVLDVGANIGYFSAIAAGLVGSTGHVHSFEPLPQNFARLSANLAPFTGPGGHASAYQCAVGECERTATFYFHAHEAGWATLYDDTVTEHSEMRVRVISLDEWAREYTPGRLDFIKLDTEGGEYQALCGAQNVIRRFRPTIVAEIKPGFHTEELFALLTELQYRRVAFGDGILAQPQP